MNKKSAGGFTMAEGLFKNDKLPRRRPKGWLEKDLRALALIDVAEDMDLERMSHREWARIAEAVNVLEQKRLPNGEEGDREIRRRAQIYRLKWPKLDLTALALVDKWELFREPKHTTTPGVRAGEQEQYERGVAERRVQAAKDHRACCAWWSGLSDEKRLEVRRRSYLMIPPIRRRDLPRPEDLDPMQVPSWACQIQAIWREEAKGP